MLHCCPFKLETAVAVEVTNSNMSESKTAMSVDSRSENLSFLNGESNQALQLEESGTADPVPQLEESGTDMSVDSGSENFLVLKGESNQSTRLEESETADSVPQHLLSSDGVHTDHLEATVMRGNSGSQQVFPSGGHQTWFGAGEMSSNPCFLSSSSMNEQSIAQKSPSNSIHTIYNHLPSIHKQLLAGDPLLQIPKAIRSSLRPLHSSQRQLAEMKFLPNIQASMFLGASAQNIPTKSRFAAYREPCPKVISATPNAGNYPSLSSQSGIEQTQQLSKMKKSVPGNVDLQKSSSMNKRTAQSEPSPKASIQSFELVRSKMRDSFAASLALESEQKREPVSEGKNLHNVGTDTSKLIELHMKPDDEASLRGASCCDTSEDHSRTSDLSIHVQGHGFENSPLLFNHGFEEVPLSHKPCVEKDEIKNEVIVSNDDFLLGNGLCWTSASSVQREEANENRDSKRPRHSRGSNSEGTEAPFEGNSKCLPANKDRQGLAVEIEAELFRAFGGVNKKYKEKGRSLLFNLKDKSNPELRMQVLSGEISPERLCSMTAEELASKELSDWRIAKAEELAQMVVLPDSDIDLRRVVKKTHKGEFQVEVEHDHSDSVEVAVGATSLLQDSTKLNADVMHSVRKSSKLKSNVLSSHNSSNVDQSALTDKIKASDQILSNNLTKYPDERTNVMEEIIVEELKDRELFEQVPSVNEFMYLDSEPQFENLADDIHVKTISSERTFGSLETTSDDELARSKLKLDPSGDTTVPKQGPSMSSDSKTDTSKASSVVLDDKGSSDLLDLAASFSTEMESKHKGPETTLENSTPMDSDTPSSPGTRNADLVWEGLIQLSISSLVTVVGSYKSGEQTSTKDWPSLLEIKGRVRLDAFEKFLKELPSSRSRATMILQFRWKEGSQESGLASLSEMIDSYIADERVGYAQPVPGVEIYLCPLHEKINQVLMKQLPKEHIDILTSTDNGLIGVVVWRRPNVSSKRSPRAASHHQHNSKRHASLRKHQHSKANVVSSSTVVSSPIAVSSPVIVSSPIVLSSAPSLLGPVPVNRNLSAMHPKDDTPPGFGPAPVRDDDDLPEFDFNRDTSHISAPKLHAHPPVQPVEQIRKLIHKYGHNESRNSISTGVSTWNDNDDDDDIPEWKPHQDVRLQPLPPPLLPSQLHSYQQQTMHPNFGEHLVPMQLQQRLQQPFPLSSVHSHQKQLASIASSLPLQLQPTRSPTGVMQSGKWWASPQGRGAIQYPATNGVQFVEAQDYSNQGILYPHNAIGRRHDPTNR